MKNTFALITLEYPPFRGGVAAYLQGLVEASGGQVKVFDQLSFSQRGPWKWRALIPWMMSLRGEYETLLISHVLPIGTAAWIASWFGGPAYVIFLHGMDVRLAVRTPWRRWLLRQILRRAKLVVTNSCFVSDEVVRFDSMVQPLVILPAVANIVSDDRGERRSRSVAFTILSVCRLVPRKGIDHLIEALKRLPSDVRLIIVGYGDDLERLQKLSVATLGTDAASRIQFISDASDDQREELYHSTDVFCVPARDEGESVEGFGVVYLEAARAGLPIVAGRSGGVSEAVQDGVTGVVVDPHSIEQIAQAIQRLYDDPTLRQQLGQQGRERVKKDFSWTERWGRLLSAISHEDVGLDRVDSMISIVIPVFNHAEELMECLQHLEQQTYQKFEVIIVNDSSTDDIKDRLVTYRPSFAMRVIHLEQNHGPQFARNEGMRQATGSFLLFLDADVNLVPTALEEMMHALALHPEASFAYSSFLFGWKKFTCRAFDVKALRACNYIHTSSLVHREAMVPFDESLKKFQDWDIWLTLAEQGKRGVWIPRVLFAVGVSAKRRSVAMSRWLPSIVHRLPWPLFGWIPREVRRYREAKNSICEKHHL